MDVGRLMSMVADVVYLMPIFNILDMVFGNSCSMIDSGVNSFRFVMVRDEHTEELIDRAKELLLPMDVELRVYDYRTEDTFLYFDIILRTTIEIINEVEVEMPLVLSSMAPIEELVELLCGVFRGSVDFLSIYYYNLCFYVIVFNLDVCLYKEVFNDLFLESLWVCVDWTVYEDRVVYRFSYGEDVGDDDELYECA